MTAYRLYLRSCGRIVGRHEFESGDDTGACLLAQLLGEAAADVCDTIELWQGGRAVLIARTLPSDAAGEVPAEPVIAAAEAILNGDWPARQSRRLLGRLEAWRLGAAPRSLAEVIREAVAATGADTGNIQLHDGAGALRIAAQHGHDREFLDFFAVVRHSETSCARALHRAARVIVEDVATDPIFRGNASGDMMLRAGLRSVHSTPIVLDGAVRGMLSTHRRINWRPDPDELRRVDAFSAEAGAIMASLLR